MLFLNFALFVVGFIFLNKVNNRIAELKRKVENLEQNLHPAHVAKAAAKVTVDQAPAAQVSSVQMPVVQVAEVSPVAPAAAAVQSIAIEPINRSYRSSEEYLATEVASQPSAMSALFGKVKNYFMTGNTIVKVGVVLIFFGISFLLKYAIDNDMLPIEIRLIASALFGVGLVKLGWNLRAKAREYGLVLQGGGIGVLMLTTFVSLKSYGMISPSVAFFLLVSFTAATCFLAVYQD
jgi:uncharacterized membrane protein